MTLTGAYIIKGVLDITTHRRPNATRGPPGCLAWDSLQREAQRETLEKHLPVSCLVTCLGSVVAETLAGDSPLWYSALWHC